MRPFWVAGGIVSRSVLPLRASMLDLAAEQRLAERERQLHGEVVAIAAEDRVRRDVDGDVDVAAALGLA